MQGNEIWRRTAAALGLAFLVSACDAGSFVGPESEPGSIFIAPASATVSPGREVQLTAVVYDDDGNEVQGAAMEWSSLEEGIASVNNAGRVTAMSLGVAMIVGVASSGSADTAVVTVRDLDLNPTDPPADVTELILGPQVSVGSHPWPAFDEAQVGSAEKWANAYLNDESGGDDYYDLALVLYQIYARTGETTYRDLALWVALKAWEGMPGATRWTVTPNAFAQSPRMTPFAGLMLLALSGVETPTLTFTNPNDPDWSETYTLWEWLEGYADKHNGNWLERWEDTNDGIHSGIRDGGMLLRYLALLSQAHPDAAVRERMLDHALTAARDYYADEQQPNGAWLWNPGDLTDATQPFQVGLLLEGLIAVHQLTGDAAVGQAIALGTEAMGRDMIDRRNVPYDLLPGKKILAAFYFAYGGECDPPIESGCGNDFDRTWDSWVAKNKLRVKRHRNTLMVHAFGYAHRLTGEQRFLDWGDELFSATYGDPDAPVLDNKGKEYNQAFRSSGRYLAWRIQE